jgi:dihydropteroate synthase
MVGPSRKRFIGELTGLPVDQRDAGTVGAALAAAAAGANLVRVHDVASLRPALTVFEAVRAHGQARVR